MTVLLPDLGPIRATKPVSFSRQEIFEFVVHATWYASRLYTRAHLVQLILLAVFSYSKTIGVSHQSFAAEKMFFSYMFNIMLATQLMLIRQLFAVCLTSITMLNCIQPRENIRLM